MIDHKQMRYVPGISRKPLPEGRVLVHNHVIPQPRIGMNGFRAWTQLLTNELVLCTCDWAGQDLHGRPHYRVNPCSRPCSRPLFWPVLVRLGWTQSLRQQNLAAHGR